MHGDLGDPLMRGAHEGADALLVCDIEHVDDRTDFLEPHRLSPGPLLASDPTEASARLRVLQATEEVYGASVVPYDAAAARVFGSVVTDVVRRGRSPRSRIGDLQIAAIAIANRLPLYTINVGDFTGIRILEVVPVPPCPDVIGATSNPI